VRFRDDLFRGGDRFLLFALGDAIGTFTRLVDHLLRGGVGVRENLGIALLRVGQLLLDLLRVKQAFSNALPPLFEDAEDRLVGKTPQRERHNRKADYLRKEQPQIEAERARCFSSNIAETALCQDC